MFSSSRKSTLSIVLLVMASSSVCVIYSSVPESNSDSQPPITVTRHLHARIDKYNLDVLKQERTIWDTRLQAAISLQVNAPELQPKLKHKSKDRKQLNKDIEQAKKRQEELEKLIETFDDTIEAFEEWEDAIKAVENLKATLGSDEQGDHKLKKALDKQRKAKREANKLMKVLKFLIQKQETGKSINLAVFSFGQLISAIGMSAAVYYLGITQIPEFNTTTINITFPFTNSTSATSGGSTFWQSGWTISGIMIVLVCVVLPLMCYLIQRKPILTVNPHAEEAEASFSSDALSTADSSTHKKPRSMKSIQDIFSTDWPKADA